MDHGILNLPLNKRGNGSIESQIDAYKRSEASAKAKVRKLVAECTKANRITAKALVAATTDARWQELADHAGQSVAAVRKHITSQAHWQPAFVIRLLKKAESDVAAPEPTKPELRAADCTTTKDWEQWARERREYEEPYGAIGGRY